MATPKKDYEVGYGRPPEEHQFKKGQVNNPSGRAGKAGKSNAASQGKEFAQTLNEGLQKKHKVMVHGKEQWLPASEVIIEQLLLDAMKGRPKALREILMIQKQFPELFEKKQLPFTEIVMTVFYPNPFEIETATITKFREAFGEVPQQHIDMLRVYFPESWNPTDNTMEWFNPPSARAHRRVLPRGGASQKVPPR